MNTMSEEMAKVTVVSLTPPRAKIMSITKLAKHNRNSPAATERKTFSGSNSTVSLSISMSVLGPCRHWRTVLAPIRSPAFIGMYLILRLDLSMAKVPVVEKENPQGIKWR